MEPLSGDAYAHLWDFQENREFGDPFKLHWVGGDEESGGVLILDFNTGPEPRVLWLWRDLGDELRDEGDGTFDQMVVRQRDVTAGRQRGDARVRCVTPELLLKLYTLDSCAPGNRKL